MAKHRSATHFLNRLIVSPGFLPENSSLETIVTQIATAAPIAVATV